MRSEGNVVMYLHLHLNAVSHIAAAPLCADEFILVDLTSVV